MSAEAVEAARVPGWEMEVLGEMPGAAHTNVLGHMDKDEHKQGYSVPDCTVIPNPTLEKATETLCVCGGVESAEAETQRESWHCGGKVWEVLLDSSPSSRIGECFTGENGKQSQRPGSPAFR